MNKTVKVAYIGLGRRGTGMLRDFLLKMKDVETTWVCDLDEKKIENTKNIFKEMNLPEPKTTTDYKDILADAAVDAIIIMTGWNDRVEMAINCMRAGKPVGIEVGCAYDLQQCYDLVKAYEETGIPCMMLENACYERDDMAAIRMEREGVFGEIVFCSGAYRHYLNSGELVKKNEDGSYDMDHYRIAEYLNRNCHCYPTHELGSIAKLLKINKGNRMLTLTSFSSKSRGLKHYLANNAPDHPYADKDIKQGDIVTTLITCAGGEMIQITLDTTLIRPYYSFEFCVRGTKGMLEEHLAERCTYFVEGMEHGQSNYGNQEEAYKKYDHPLYQEAQNCVFEGGHGSIDWFVLRAFIESVKDGTEPPIDTYDTASWLAIGPLTEASIANGSTAVEVPDFTNGKWFRRTDFNKGKYSLDLVISDPDTPIFPE